MAESKKPAPEGLPYSPHTHDIVPIVEHSKGGESGYIAMKGAGHHDIANTVAQLSADGHKTNIRYAAIVKPNAPKSEKSSLIKPPAAKPAAKKTAAGKPDAAKPAPKKVAPKKAK